MKLTVFVNWFSQRPFLKSVLTLGSSTVAGQAIVLLATPILTRLYSPEEFGQFAVFLAFGSVLLTISSLRYDIAIPLPRKDVDGRLLLWIALALNAFFGLFVLLIVLIFGKFAADALNSPDMSRFAWILPLVVFIGGTYKALNYFAIRNREFHVIGQTRIFQSSTSVGIQIGSGAFGLGFGGLIVGWVAGQTAGVLTLWKSSKLECREFFIEQRWLRIRALVRKYSRFPKYDVLASLVDTVSTQFPSVLLAALFGPSVAGFYLLSHRVLSVPSALIGQAVAQVLLGRIRSTSDGIYLRNILKRMVLGLASLMALPSLVIFFFGDSLFVVAFGDEWQMSGVYAAWMIIGIAVQFVYSPSSVILAATGGQHLNLVIQLVLIVGKILAILYGFGLGEPLVSIIAFSLVNTLGYSLGLFLIRLHIRMRS